jgi:hypothetical protein
MVKAFTFGILTLIVINGIWFLALETAFFSGALSISIQVAPFLAAFITAIIAPWKKVHFALLMALPASLIAVVINIIYQALGRVIDFPGLKGGLIFFIINFLYNVVLCLLGGVLGYLLSKKFRKKF